MQQLSINIDLALSGKTLDEIIPPERLRELHKLLDGIGQPVLLRYLGHSKPNMTILEIGNGRASVASEVLSCLTTSDGHVLCSKYTFTSTGYISEKD